MSENRDINASEDIILDIPAISDKEGQLKNEYEIGKGWPYYKDFDLCGENYEFKGEVRPFLTLEAIPGLKCGPVAFPPPLEAASEGNGKFDEGLPEELNIRSLSLDELNARLNGINERTEFYSQGAGPDSPGGGDMSLRGMDETEESLSFFKADIMSCGLDETYSGLKSFDAKDINMCGLDEIDARLNGFDAKDIGICGLDGIDNSLYSQDGIDKNNYRDAEVTGFNLELGAGSANLDLDLDLDFDFGFDLDLGKPESGKISLDFFSQINKRLQPFVKRMLAGSGYKTGAFKNKEYDKEAISGIVDGIMDKLQNEFDEAEDISLEVQRTDWSRYRLLRALTELLVIVELER